VSTDRALRIGTRGSALALWQARAVASLLEAAGAPAELVTIKTSGDRLQERPLTEQGTKRLFVKEIEDALLDGDVDLAVHSAKDMPAVLPEGLDIGAALAREDPRDALVLAPTAPRGELDVVLRYLGDAPAIATSSVRRSAQLLALIPRARFVAIRGNVDTRLRKLEAEGYDALVLAVAGMRRLGFEGRISLALPIDVCIPAPGQGIVAIEIRADDAATRQSVEHVHDRAAGASLAAERALVAALGGGCQLPLGAVALHDFGDLDMHAVVSSVDGQRVVRRRLRGSAARPEDLGRRLADDLATGGAVEILEGVRS
jgi:hydroxymethylbilane synthase